MPAKTPAQPRVDVSTVATPSSGEPQPADADAASGPNLLGVLPRGAAVYVSMRLELMRSLPEDYRRALLGGDASTVDGLADAVHVDPTRAILAAVLSPSEPDARAVIDAVVNGAKGKALDRVIAEHATSAVLFRVVIPISGGGDVADAARRLGKAVVLGSDVVPCSEGKLCEGFADPKPLGIAVHDSRAVAVYAQSGTVRLDIAESLFGKGADAALASTLARMAPLVGGPEPPRCAAFDSRAGAAACVDADNVAQLGATIGYSKTIRALLWPDVPAEVVPRIAREGRAESLQNLALATPSRRLTDDGTLWLRFSGGEIVSLMSWQLTSAARLNVEQTFGSEPSCAKDDEVFKILVPRLLDAFGDPGPEFTDAQRTLTELQQAGWGGWMVLFARSWPNVLLAEHGQLDGFEPRELGTVCARTRAGRLEIESHSKRR